MFTWKMGETLEKSGNFVSLIKWEPRLFRLVLNTESTKVATPANANVVYNIKLSTGCSFDSSICIPHFTFNDLFILQISCDYFVKQAQGSETMETGYPYAHVFSSYKGDSQLPNVSRNGQYCTLDEGFLNNQDKMTELLVQLGSENNVSTFYSNLLM